MTDASSPSGISSQSISSTPSGGAAAARHVSQFQELTHRISAAGLMRRRYGFYWAAFAVAAVALAGVWMGVFLLGDSWLQLLLASVLGLLFVVVDVQTGALMQAWLVPSLVFGELAGDANSRGRLRFNASLKPGSGDKWSSFRLSPSQLAPRIIDRLSELSVDRAAEEVS